MALSAGPRAKYLHFLRTSTPATKRNFQRAYFALSLLLLWLLLGLSTKISDKSILLACVYMGVFLALMYLFAPRETMRTVWSSIGTLVKLSLMVNFLCALILVESLLTIWVERASALVTLFMVAWAGFWIFSAILYPSITEIKNIFSDDSDKKFDPGSPQGRNIRRD